MLVMSGLAATPARAAPGSDDYSIQRIVRPSTFHGVHGLAFDAAGVLYAGSVAGDAIYRVDPVHGTARIEVAAPDGQADDLTFLHDGTLVWTSINDGVVRARKSDGSVVVIASGLPGINSIAERASDHRLFAAQVFQGDGLWELDPSGAQPPRQILADIGGLNGFDFGADGMIYGPLWFKHQVVRIDPDSPSHTVLSDDFVTPAAANFDSRGRLYVVDAATGELSVLNVDSGDKRAVAQLSPALDNLAIDARDRVFVSNMADNGIQQVNPVTGSVLQVMKGTLAMPYAIAVSHDIRDRIFIADLFAFRELDVWSGVVRELARSWAQGSPINYAIGVSVSGQDLVLVNSGDLVQRWDTATCQLQRTWSVPKAIAAVQLPDRRLIALDSTGALLQIADTPDATPTALPFGLGGYGALALAKDGTLYAVAVATGTLYAVGVDDGSNRVVTSGLSAPRSIAMLPSGEIAVAEAGAARISAVDPSSGASRVIARDLPLLIPGNPRSPVSLSASSDGTLYVTSAAENSIYRLRPRHD
jgi:sugar lactone lactonase YvrE